MHKRTLTAVALGTVAALGLAACSSGGGGIDPSNANGATLDVWIMQGTNPSADEFFAEVETAFEDQTGADLNVQFVQWADAHDQFVNAIAGGTTPDVAETGTTWTAEFADAGALAAIGDRVDAAGLSDDLVEGLRDAGTYDGELYGMPWYAGVRSLVYRSDIFEELGLEAPTNWQELQDAAQAIHDAKPDMTAMAIPGDAEMTVYPWVWGAGGEIATETDGTWTSQLDSPEAIEGIQFYTGLATEYGFSSAGATTWKETDVLTNFASGNVAMAVMGSWTPAAVLEQNPEMEGMIAATPIPGRDGGIAKSVLGGSHLSMFNTSENQDLAWVFMEMMTTGEFAEGWSEQTGYFPGQASLLESATQSDDPLVAPFATQFVDGGGTVPVTPAFGAVQAKKTVNAAMQAILSGESSVDEAMSQAATEMTETLNSGR